MTTKKIEFCTKPTNRPVPDAVDSWVESRAVVEQAVVEPMKRLTIDIPESLHRSIKSQCAMRGSKIADEVRELLSQKYGNT